MGEWFYAVGRFVRGLFVPTKQEQRKTKEQIDKEVQRQLDLKFPDKE